MISKYILLFGLCLFQSCVISKDFYTLPAMATATTFNAVIEIPAGTNKKFEYNTLQKKFVIDRENGVERIIDFLPYPSNYGFIPSTLSKTDSGGDGDALDVLVIASSLPTGTVIETSPIALFKLIDDGETDYKILAVPTDTNLQIIEATTYDDLVKNYPKLLEIVSLWFLSYNPNDISTVEGWGDEKEAFDEIQRHLKIKQP